MKNTFDLNLNSADLAEADEATKKGRKPVIKGWHFSRYGRLTPARRGRERLYMSVILDPWCGFGEEYIRVSVRTASSLMSSSETSMEESLVPTHSREYKKERKTNVFGLFN